MTDKNIWLKAKKNREYTIQILYDFWTENKKETYKNLTIEEFAPLIQEYVSNNGHISIERLEELFDKKFNIVKVFNKERKLIKEL